MKRATILFGKKWVYLIPLLLFLQRNAQGQSCNCPPVDECGVCQGGVTSLTFKYNGILLPAVIIAEDNGGHIQTFVVPAGGTFTVIGSLPNGTFQGNVLRLKILAIVNATINTSCGTAIYEGSTFGNFTVISGQSKDGGALCCSPGDMETLDPVISNCPGDITVATGSFDCIATVNWTAPTATDNCGAVTLTSTHNAGDTFSKGTTTVVYTATDDYGNISICTFNVVVNDETNPVISGCPSNINVIADTNCEAVVTWTPPTATDNCGSVTLTRTHSPGDVFDLGTTQVTYTATDGSGKISTCTFDVVVTDDIDPVISGCPSDITVNANGSCEATASWTVPTASDNCSGVTLTSSKNPGDNFLLGTTLVTYTATDPAGNTATCTFNVIVVDDTDPTISGCPANIIVNANGSCEATASWTIPAASDNCAGVTLTSSKNPGDNFLLGTTLVTYIATDAAGNTATCTFNVTVVDDTDPVMTGCPVSDVLAVTNGSCEATVTWSPPTASDNCSGVTLTSNKNPGDLFPKGTTVVTYTATDAAGNTATCIFNVIVSDDTDPVITGCPAADIVAVANGSCEATVTWTVPTASDNCNLVTMTSNKNPGDLFSLGTTVVTYTATDVAGNQSTCNFNVVVSDNADPVITGCPSDIIVSANASCDAVVNWTAPIVTDNCTTVGIASTHDPGDTFALGTTVVIYTATDGSNNISTCSFNVVVTDDTDPIISGCLASDITVTANASCQAIAHWIAPTVNDNCGPVTMESSHDPGDAFSFGTTTVTYTATDGFGNTSVCNFNVVVTDVTNPVFSGCILSDVVVTANNDCEAPATWTPPTATDNCGSPVITSTHVPGNVFPLGTTIVTYTAKDGSGNTSLCSFNVVVKDESDPVFTACITSDITINADASCKATVSWTPPLATDNCNTPVITSTHAPGTIFSLGTTLVTYTATDASGNTATCSFNVIVTDNTNPVISGCIPSDIIVSADASCQKIVSWIVPMASDNCSSVTLTSTHDPGDSFSFGSTQVIYTAKDASGNTSTCNFNVIVTDQIGPVISGCIISDIIAEAGAACNASVSWNTPAATDNCSSVILSSTHEPGDIFQIGATPVVYTATDASGNTSTCTFNVIVVDETAPTISGCSNVNALANESCETAVTWTAPTAIDCNTVNMVSSHRPGDLFAIGTTAVTYTATDNKGNTSSCSFYVIVEDKSAPVFEDCPAEMVVQTDDACNASVSWNEPTVSDNCETFTISKSHVSGAVFPIGTTNVKYTATDQFGNASVCEFNVVVIVASLPVFHSCPEDIQLQSNAYGEAPAEWTPPQATTSCSDVVLTGSHQSGDVFLVGTTVVEYKAVDGHGNMSYCRFNVTVTRQEIDIDISNVVTPDGNGQNDEWMISNIEKFTDNKVVIVDRWGSVIYTASGYNNTSVAWKGANRNGDMVPTGTYFYTISVRYGPALFEKSGFIELIR